MLSEIYLELICAARYKAAIFGFWVRPLGNRLKQELSGVVAENECGTEEIVFPRIISRTH